jgi:hypothetical protein
MGFFDDFPRLAARTGWRNTSDATPSYNCIAWSAGDSKRCWWPTRGGYWPPGVMRARTLDAFVKAFATKGYVRCESSALETGFLKIAIYVKDGIPTHAARQLETGKWTSKLGQNVDIEHDSPELVGGALYGEAVAFMRRPHPPASAPGPLSPSLSSEPAA